jgi:hypothetical protein
MYRYSTIPVIDLDAILLNIDTRTMIDKDPEIVEACAVDVVDCIRQCVDAIRSEFPIISINNKPRKQQQSGATVALYTRLVDRGLFQRVQETTKRQRKELGDVDGGAEICFSNLDDERYRLVHDILLPLIQSLSRCYELLDQLPQPPPPPPKEERRRKDKKPTPPRGLLSIQNYTDIACLLEFTICTSILPHLDPFVLSSIEDRVRYNLPKSLAGRIPKSSLAWASRQPVYVEETEELFQSASVIANLLLLDRFRPMLLPRHIADIYAAFFQSEQSLASDQRRQQQQSPIYQQLGLTSVKTMEMDVSLQAKAYQSLLLQGTKAPSWIRQRVSPLLTQLACTNLVAIVQVFVPLQEPSSASQRLGRALATSAKGPTTTKALCREILGLLKVIFPVLVKGEIPARAMAILQTIWAVLYHWPTETIQQELIQVWEQGMLGRDNPSSIHATIRQIGALCAFVPPSTNPLIILQGLFSPETFLFGQLVRMASMPSILASTAREDARHALHWLSLALYTSKQEITIRGMTVTGPSLLVAAWVHALAPSPWDMSGFKYSLISSKEEQSAQNGPSTALESLQMQKDESSIINVATLAKDITKRTEILSETVLQACASDENSNEESNSQPSIRGFPPQLFRLLLSIYLAKSAPTKASSSAILDSYQLVAIVLLPSLCEKCSPEDLLFGDGGDAIGLLSLVKLVLTCAKSRLENQSGEIADRVEDVTESDRSNITDESMVKCLEMLGNHRDAPNGNLQPLDGNNESDNDETLLSIASIILSLLIAVLELGSKLRSAEEEDKLKSFLPILQPLAEFSNASTTDLPPSQESEAGMADMASYAMALIASRQAPENKTSTANKPGPLSTMDKLKRSLSQAEEDLQSTQPPLRARGMVSLGRLARGYLGIVPKEKVPLVMELEHPNSAEDDPVVFLIQEVLKLAMVALSDTESYVYLAVSYFDVNGILPVIGFVSDIMFDS